MLVRIKGPAGTGGWLVEPETFSAGAVFVPKTSSDPADTEELDVWVQLYGEVSRTPYVEVESTAKGVRTLRIQAVWR